MVLLIWTTKKSETFFCWTLHVIMSKDCYGGPSFIFSLCASPLTLYIHFAPAGLFAHIYGKGRTFDPPDVAPANNFFRLILLIDI